MKDLFAIEPGIVKRSKNEPVFDTLCDALKLFFAQDIPLPLKTDAFELLPMYICVDDSCLDSVKNCSEVIAALFHWNLYYLCSLVILSKKQ